MADNYKQFDKDSTVDISEVIIKGFRFRKREIALGLTLLVCLLVIIILAALLAAHKNQTSDSSASAGAQSQMPGTCYSPTCFKTAAHVMELINDTDSKPCDDFYSFACGNFPTLHPLQLDESMTSTFWLMYSKNQERLRKLVETVSSSLDPSHYETKLKTFYTSCNDHFHRMNQQGKPFLERVVQPAGGWWGLVGDQAWPPSGYSFQGQLEKVHVDFWTDAFFTFSVGTDWLNWNNSTIQIDLGGFGIPYQYFYGSRYQKEVSDYKTFIRTVGGLLLRDANLNITEEERVYRLDTFVNDAFFVESELAMLKRDAESEAFPHSLDRRPNLSALNAASGGALDWVRFFKYMFNASSVSEDTYVVVFEQQYVNNLTAWINGLDSSNKTRILNNYMTWRLAHTYTRDLSWDYIQARHQVYVDITGSPDVQPDWRYCLGVVDRTMPDALSALFVRDHFSDQNRLSAHQITDYVKKALVDSISHDLHWMTAETRDIAVRKIESSLIKLGYPDFMMHPNAINHIYDPLTIDRSDYFGNKLSFNKLYRSQWNSRLSSPNDHTAWVYPTYSFRAEYYNPWKELIVPAGFLQFPVYDHSSPRYMNFGSMGSIVARELTHAVDEIGNMFNLNGSHYGSWWSGGTSLMYHAVRNCMVNSYQKYSSGPFDLPGFDDDFTIPINTNYYAPYALAESSGVQLAYKAYQHWIEVTGGDKAMPGGKYSNDQLFFIAYAQSFCANRDPFDELRLALSSGSVLEKIRINGALSHVKEFQETFKCSDKSKMVAPKRCTLY